MEGGAEKEEEFRAAYSLISEDAFSGKVMEAARLLSECTLCPRECRIDRRSGERGYCRTGERPSVASWGPHFGEERPLVGIRGSGTIFFGNCNLGCIFCQNHSISHGGEGVEMPQEKLADVMLSLQRAGCHNINLVTPTHQVPAIIGALKMASERGLKVPVVYNCGGYESIGALKLLEGIVDIYMPDFKYWDAGYSSKYSGAADYPEAAMAAIKEMHRQVGDLLIDGRGIALRGLLVRHLVLPGNVSGTDKVVRFIASEISPYTYINIMDQYHPCYDAFGSPPLDRRISKKEYSDAIRWAIEAGLKRIDGVTI